MKHCPYVGLKLTKVHLCGPRNRRRPLLLLTLFIYTEGSVYVGTNRRGSEDKPLITQSYEVPEFLGFNGYLEVTQDGCIPLSEAIYKNAAGCKFFLINSEIIARVLLRENKTQSH